LENGKEGRGQSWNSSYAVLEDAAVIDQCVRVFVEEGRKRAKRTDIPCQRCSFLKRVQLSSDMMALFVGRMEESETHPALQTTILEARAGKVIEYGVVLLDFRIRSVG
jgi:hypothetical protein